MNQQPKNFWQRLKAFIENVEVRDQPGEEEKQMILSVCEGYTKQPPNASIISETMGKLSVLDAAKFSEWVAERYNYYGGELCVWVSKNYSVKDRDQHRDTVQLIKYWWENCR